jgi:hypothetical protein
MQIYRGFAKNGAVKTWCFVVKCVVNVVLGMAVSDLNTTDC